MLRVYWVSIMVTELAVGKSDMNETIMTNSDFKEEPFIISYSHQMTKSIKLSQIKFQTLAIFCTYGTLP